MLKEISIHSVEKIEIKNKQYSDFMITKIIVKDKKGNDFTINLFQDHEKSDK